MTDRAYSTLRALVQRLGGSMHYDRRASRYGAWVITLQDKSLIIEAPGNRSFPELDRLHVAKVPDPKDWSDYAEELVPDAEDRLIALLHASGSPNTPIDYSELESVIERAKWKFAWTYARTYPHEYTTKALCDPTDHAKLIRAIERDGRIERFGHAHRKYLHWEERKYWHMGEPDSEDPEKWPNVINRTWVDVRRHAENVRHRWTPEEVELQMRLWEIQLEKTTDRGKRKG